MKNITEEQFNDFVGRVSRFIRDTQHIVVNSDEDLKRQWTDINELIRQFQCGCIDDVYQADDSQLSFEFDTFVK